MTSYVASRALLLQFEPSGRIAATTTTGQDPVPISREELAVLAAFAREASVEQAHAALAGQAAALDRARFGEIARQLVARRLLLAPGDRTSTSPIQSGFGSIIPHVGMLRDEIRVRAYRAAIERHVGGRRVAEIGAGTGALSIFAVLAGAARVVAVEETAIAEVASRMFEANGCADRIDLHRCNSRDADFEPVDVLIHEIVGDDPLDEGLLSSIDDARARLLRPGGRLIPWRIEILCVGLDSHGLRRQDRDSLLAEASELQGLHGIDMSPVLDAARALDPRSFCIRQQRLRGRFDRTVLTGECPLHDLDLRGPTALAPEVRSSARVERDGALGDVAIYFRLHLDDSIRLTNSPFTPRTNWGWLVRPLSRVVKVRAGDEIPFVARVETQLGRAYVTVDVG